MLFISFLWMGLPTLALLLFAGLVIKVVLQGVFKLFGWPNYTTKSPSSLVSWRKLAAPDILFRLATLAALNAVMYWMPIYYWTTYTPSGDDRDGGVMIPGLAFSPVSWIMGLICFVQVWRPNQTSTVAHRVAFQIMSLVLLLLVLSTLIPQIRFYLGVFRE